ncbi:Protein of unknown function (DUF410) [Fragilaria crotonensis]|nr:Protein of unknown function (DUF410) [Fragilaria crotonensis]
MSVPSGVQRTSLQLFRDCLRLVRHVAPGRSAKSLALRTTVRTQFELGRRETDPHAIEVLKANAIRALSNYMLYESGSRDATMKKAMDKYHHTAVSKAKQANSDERDSAGEV